MNTNKTLANVAPFQSPFAVSDESTNSTASTLPGRGNMRGRGRQNMRGRGKGRSQGFRSTCCCGTDNCQNGAEPRRAKNYRKETPYERDPEQQTKIRESRRAEFQEIYQSELKYLLVQGYTRERLNLRLLIKTKGDLELTVKTLNELPHRGCRRGRNPHGNRGMGKALGRSNRPIEPDTETH